MQGLFAFNNKDISDRYNPVYIPLMFAHLALLAEGLNKPDDAYQNSLKAFDLARKQGELGVLMMVTGVCCQYSIIEREFEEAFESYMLFATVSFSGEGTTKEKYAALSHLNLESILKLKTSESQKTAEEVTAISGVIPMYIALVNDFCNNAANKQLYLNKFLQVIMDYKANAANIFLFEFIHEIVKRTFNRSVTEKELIDRANVFSSTGSKERQLLAIVSLIYTTSNPVTIIEQVTNVIPVILEHCPSSFSAIRKFILTPFVVLSVERAIKIFFEDNETAYSLVNNKIQRLEQNSSSFLRDLLKIACESLQIEIAGKRKDWFENGHF